MAIVNLLPTRNVNLAHFPDLGKGDGWAISIMLERGPKASLPLSFILNVRLMIITPLAYNQQGQLITGVKAEEEK